MWCKKYWNIILIKGEVCTQKCFINILSHMSLYIKKNKFEILQIDPFVTLNVYIAMYVNYLLIIGQKAENIEQVNGLLKSKFTIKDLAVSQIFSDN